MAKFKRKFDFTKSRFSGKVKETVGKLTGNQQLELDGKIETSKADLKQKMDIGENIDKLKETIAKKINDTIDGK